MRWLKYFGVALQSIQAHKLRAVLTMLGIIIGVAAVLVTVGIGSGAAQSITERIESSGANLLTISGGARGSSAGTKLSMVDAELLADPKFFPDIKFVAPQYTASATLTHEASEGSYQVVGTTEAYAPVRNLSLASGEFLTADQVAQDEKVVVLGATVASDLFGGQDALGQSIRIDDALFQVTGVLEAAGGSGFGSSDNQVFAPIDVALGRLFNAGRVRGAYPVSTISIQVNSQDRLTATSQQIERVLRLRHGLGADDENDFQISNQADLLAVASDVSGTLSALLGSIGAVSLLVGGIGIMNIMLVSVTERTREIGLRKAIGARDRDILLQFLIEALVLCALGGLIGIGLSYGVQWLVGQIPGGAFRVVIQPWAVGLALIVSTVSGFVFGLYPAVRATQLDPIEALRYE
ncbi:MAG: ABC transporter permease [Caldilinea sp.]|uniref:ABC transporter permease n=1 Tax=Caldilinea sp. TaxID=2293560 RepID=UPI002C6961C3|nr:ABC transporter permease [Anaerolineales bacterium]HQY91842.1 ABC transporter permease [Caldilinea sp.]